MDKTATLVLVAAILLLGGYLISNYAPKAGTPTAYAVYVDTLKSGAKKAVSETPQASVEYRVVVLTDSSCASCKTDEITGYLNEIFPGMKTAYVDLSSPTGQKLVKKYGLATVPAYVLNLQVESSPNFKLVENALTKVGDGYVVNLDDEFVGKRI
jgi:hypothetical protein